MQPTLVREVFHRPGWIYETKYDGWRMVALKDGSSVRLFSRQAVDHTERFADVPAAVAKPPGRSLILDGEICVFDSQLVSQFHLLGEQHSEEEVTPPVYIAFDALHRGRDVRDEPLAYRRQTLERREDELRVSDDVFYRTAKATESPSM
jgi:bifunctional non-homologous end joining protein LigD